MSLPEDIEKKAIIYYNAKMSSSVNMAGKGFAKHLTRDFIQLYPLPDDVHRMDIEEFFLELLSNHPSVEVRRIFDGSESDYSEESEVDSESDYESDFGSGHSSPVAKSKMMPANASFRRHVGSGKEVKIGDNIHIKRDAKTSPTPRSSTQGRRQSGTSGPVESMVSPSSKYNPPSKKIKGSAWPTHTIEPPPSKEKKSERKLDKSVLSEWSKEKRSNWPSQRTVMKNYSAQQYVESFPIQNIHILDASQTQQNPWDWEWLHLVAFSMGGNQASWSPQDQKNLVAGTYSCNTWMLHQEIAIKQFVDGHSDKNFEIFLTVTANLTHNTHIAKKITYGYEFVNKNGASVRGEQIFNAFTHNDPPRNLHEDFLTYLHKLDED